ncbi:SRPBCC domain-containing protein [Pseudarthrobacter sp. B907]|uniref:SRPBCC family protein n=1 Tax=Pseudarthrobacter sp. B907 TaxID=3158261 RepID=UPI0032DA847D
MPLTLTAIKLDEFLPHPPAMVWRALTEPALIATWLMENNFEPVVGHRYTMRGTPVPAVGFSGLVASEVLEIVPERLLRISWRDANAGNNLSSTVTWTLVQEGTGTRLFLTHEGFDPEEPSHVVAHRIMGGGWRGQILKKLTEMLTRLGE